jgi:LacI family transcriptional regulator
LSVPGDIALVSCDNDELLCNNLSPGLTSIEADFTGIGYRAAGMLSRMMRGADVSACEVCGGVRLVVRGSSAPVSSGGALVARAMAFIDAHAVEGIGVQDVVEHLNVSRRLADLRFREVRGTSISESIRARKIEAVKDWLARTDDKVEQIAAQCGFADPKHMMAVFRQVVGCSMREWRSRARSEMWS